jgi:uncharacterized protein YndB with AHSA1/START domain
MLKIALIALGVLVILVILVLIYASTRPDTFQIQRKIAIKAPPEKVFPLVNDFHEWAKWSPWEKLDPNLKRTYGGPDSGPGATYGWEGNDKVGTGRMEILKTTPPNEVKIQLDFLKPYEAHNTGTFQFQPTSEGTEVIWTMDGEAPFMFNVMKVFIDMDGIIGKDFEKGLAAMKVEAEKA